MHICDLNLSGRKKQEDPKSLLASQPSQSVIYALIEKPQNVFFIILFIYISNVVHLPSLPSIHTGPIAPPLCL